MTRTNSNRRGRVSTLAISGSSSMTLARPHAASASTIDTSVARLVIALAPVPVNVALAVKRRHSSRRSMSEAPPHVWLVKTACTNTASMVGAVVAAGSRTNNSRCSTQKCLVSPFWSRSGSTDVIDILRTSRSSGVRNNLTGLAPRFARYRRLRLRTWLRQGASNQFHRAESPTERRRPTRWRNDMAKESKRLTEAKKEMQNFEDKCFADQRIIMEYFVGKTVKSIRCV